MLKNFASEFCLFGALFYVNADRCERFKMRVFFKLFCQRAVAFLCAIFAVLLVALT